MQRLIMFVVVLLAGLLAMPIEAHHKDGHLGGPSIVPTVFAEPDLVVIGSVVRVKGCNYDFMTSAIAEIHYGADIDIFGIGVWAQDINDCKAGRIDFPFLVSDIGIHTVKVFQKQKNKKTIQVAEGSFEVVP